MPDARMLRLRADLAGLCLLDLDRSDDKHAGMADLLGGIAQASVCRYQLDTFAQRDSQMERIRLVQQRSQQRRGIEAVCGPPSRRSAFRSWPGIA